MKKALALLVPLALQAVISACNEQDI